MGCYHPSQDGLDVCITAATQKKSSRNSRRERALAKLHSLDSSSFRSSRRPLIAADLTIPELVLNIASTVDCFSQSSGTLPRPHVRRFRCDSVVTVMGRIIEQTLFEPSPIGHDRPKQFG